MLIGTHAVVFSRNPDADRRFLSEVLELRGVDAGGGYVIFALPTAEASVHESTDANPGQELYLLCDDIKAFVARLQKHRVSCTSVEDAGWGMVTRVTLPGGGKLGIYQPRHNRPAS